MSFILEDKKLVDLLVYHGLSKMAQQYAAVNPQDFAALRGIIANLEKELSVPTSAVISGAQISTENEQPVSINSSNLENIGTLVEFLARNKITVDGQRIAYTTDETPPNPSYQAYKLPGSAGLLESANRNETIKYEYHVNKDLLSKYLDSLRAQLVKNPNPVMRAQIGDLIHQANDQLNAGVSQEYKEVKTLPGNQPIDSLPQAIKTSDPRAEGPRVLTYSDLASDTSLNSWIQQNGISLDDKDYKELNRCALLKIFYNRSSNYVTIASSVPEKEKYQVYVQQVQKLAGEMQCNLGGATQFTQQSGATTQQATLQELVEILPLRMDSLDFGRIRDFIGKYRSLVSASTDPNRAQQASTAMNQIEQYMQAATQNTVGGSMTSFSMDGLTANDLVSWATPPTQPGQQTRSRGSAKALADYLEYVVRNVYTLVKDLYNAYYAQLTDPKVSNLRQAIEQQVGGNSIPYGSSIANSNIDNIRAARNRLPQVGA